MAYLAGLGTAMPYVGRTADFALVPLGFLGAGRLGAERDAHIVTRAMILILALSGCAVIGDKRVAAGCQVADGVTSYYALTHGAVESNTLLSGISPAGILLIKLAFAYIVWKALPDYNKSSSNDKFVAGAVTLLGCVPAVNNYNVIRSLP